MNKSEELISYDSMDEAIEAANENQVIALFACGDHDSTCYVPMDASAAEMASPQGIAAMYERLRKAYDLPDIHKAPVEVPADYSDGEAGDDDEDGGRSVNPELLKLLRRKAATERQAVLDEFNAEYMVVYDNRQSWVFRETVDHAFDRHVYHNMKQGDLQLLYANRKICTRIDNDGTRTYQNVVKFWITHKDRRQYIGGVIFDPSTTQAREGFLNLWRGFAVEPKPGSWAKLKAHIRDNLCRKNREHFEYLVGWMARLVQHPDKMGEVAVVLRGGQGTGKGTLGHALRHLFGQHAMHISNSKHLVGNFNEHLRDCVFLFADEAFYAGDKQGLGTLKALITESVLTVEGKFKNALQSKNRLHVLMSSNEKWVVPAATDERRFFVLDVADDHKQDHDYFEAIVSELKAGGYEAMLYDLLNRDIIDFNVRRVPVTAALQDQKEHSLPTDAAWWLDVLQRGFVYQSKHGLEEYFGEWHEWVSNDVLYKSYEEYAKAHGERHPLSREYLGRFMVKMGAAPSRLSGGGVVGERVLDTVGNGIRTDLVRKDRATGYHLGSLEQSRAGFEAHTGLTQDWPPG